MAKAFRLTQSIRVQVSLGLDRGMKKNNKKIESDQGIFCTGTKFTRVYNVQHNGWLR